MKAKEFVSINGNKPELLGMVEVPDFEEFSESVCTPSSDIIDSLTYSLEAQRNMLYKDIFGSFLENEDRKKNDRFLDKIDHIIANPPATIILWKNGTKTVVKCMDGDEYNVEQGIAMCLFKKMLSDDGYRNLKKIMHKETVKYDSKKENENGESSGDVSKDDNSSKDKAEEETQSI